MISLNELKKVMENIPDTPENLERANALRKFLTADKKGMVKIEEMEKGIYDDMIPDPELSAFAHNLFDRIAKEHDIQTLNDFEFLFFQILNVIKRHLLEKHAMRYFSKVSDKPELTESELGYLKELQRLSNWMANLQFQHQDKLSISREKRMAKELRVADSSGNSLLAILSQIPDEDVENAKKKIPKEREEALKAIQ